MKTKRDKSALTALREYSPGKGCMTMKERAGVKLDSLDIANLVSEYLNLLVVDGVRYTHPGKNLAQALMGDLEELTKSALDDPDRAKCTSFYLREALEFGVDFGIAAALIALNAPPPEAVDRISKLVQSVKFDIQDRIECTKNYNLEQEQARKKRRKAAA